MKKIIGLIVALVIVLSAGIVGGVFIAPKLNNKKVDRSIIAETDLSVLKSETVEEIIESASELVVTDYQYTDIHTTEKDKKIFGKTIPLTTDKIILSYSGKVNVGIDFSKIKFEIDNSNKKIILKLPDIKVISHEIDESSIEYYDVKKSIFTSTTLNDYTKLFKELKDKKNNELMNDTEFIETASTNAKKVLTDFFSLSASTSEYEVVFS